jgi:RNA polymerase sigma-70 factor (ECF subfamily)
VRKKRASHVLLSDEMLDQLGALRLQHEGLLDERRGALAECVKKLPSSDRELVERCYGCGETIKTVAENRGQSPNVFYKALRRIRATLHGCVSQTLALEVGA